MITFGPRYSFLLATDSASSRLRRAGSDPPANARKVEDARTLRQLTANERTKLGQPGGIDEPDDLFGIDLSSSSTDMPGWRYAFALSKDAVKAATPPGTLVRLFGMYGTFHRYSLPSSLLCQSFSSSTSGKSRTLYPFHMSLDLGDSGFPNGILLTNLKCISCLDVLQTSTDKGKNVLNSLSIPEDHHVVIWLSDDYQWSCQIRDNLVDGRSNERRKDDTVVIELGKATGAAVADYLKLWRYSRKDSPRFQGIFWILCQQPGPGGPGD